MQREGETVNLWLKPKDLSFTLPPNVFGSFSPLTSFSCFFFPTSSSLVLFFCSFLFFLSPYLPPPSFFFSFYLFFSCFLLSFRLHSSKPVFWLQKNFNFHVLSIKTWEYGPPPCLFFIFLILSFLFFLFFIFFNVFSFFFFFFVFLFFIFFNVLL